MFAFTIVQHNYDHHSLDGWLMQLWMTHERVQVREMDSILHCVWCDSIDTSILYHHLQKLKYMECRRSLEKNKFYLFLKERWTKWESTRETWMRPCFSAEVRCEIFSRWKCHHRDLLPRFEKQMLKGSFRCFYPSRQFEEKWKSVK